jgi:hypothetical protein
VPERPDIVDSLSRLALFADLTHTPCAPELWIQKNFLVRVVSLSDDGLHDEGIVPLEHFLDSGGDDAVAAAIEMNPQAVIHPAIYVRRARRITEHELPPLPVHAFEGIAYHQELESRLKPFLG